MYDPTIGRWISEDPLGLQVPVPGEGVEVSPADPSVAWRYPRANRDVEAEKRYMFDTPRYMDVRGQRWVIPGNDKGESNLYRYVNNQPTVATDPSGLDAWVEGPSGWEPPGHLSLNIGNPRGRYKSYSFGVNGLVPWIGAVYEDTDRGGAILKDYYLSCSPETDEALTRKYDAMIGDEAWYGPQAETCRGWSFRQFSQIEADFAKDVKKVAPPARPAVAWPGGWVRGATTTTGTTTTAIILVK